MATAPALPEAELVARLQQRDRSAWEQLYRLYEGRLYAFAYRLTGNSRDASDLVQATFLRALPRLDRLDPAAVNLSAYLFATARTIFLREVEEGTQAEPRRQEPETDEPQPLENRPERSAMLLERQSEVRRANARLAPGQRVALALRELQGRSYAEIGERVGLDENDVAQLIAQARQGLRDELRLGLVDQGAVPDECRRLLPLLSAHLDGELKEPGRSEVLAHVARCEHCRAALEEMREASRRYRDLVPPAALTGLFERVDHALAATSYWDKRPSAGPPRKLHRTRRVLGFALVVALVGLVIAVVVVYPFFDTPEWPKLGPRPKAQPRQTQPPSPSANATTPAGPPSARPRMAGQESRPEPRH
jgi:RNA polymerase sigma factor (sigma-70 family)